MKTKAPIVFLGIAALALLAISKVGNKTKTQTSPLAGSAGAAAQSKMCPGGYWQGSLATGHCVFPAHGHPGGAMAAVPHPANARIFNMRNAA